MKNKALKSVQKGSFILPTPLLVVFSFIMLVIILYWIKKDYGIISISLFILCLLSFFLRKGFEINGNKFFEYTRFFYFKKIKKIEIYEEGIKELFLDKTKKKIRIQSSIPRDRSGRVIYYYVRVCYYALTIETHSERVIAILKSEDYGYISKYVKLFSKYYDIPISVRDIKIKYPATGNLVEEHLKTKETIVIHEKYGTEENTKGIQALNRIEQKLKEQDEAYERRKKAEKKAKRKSSEYRKKTIAKILLWLIAIVVIIAIFSYC